MTIRTSLVSGAALGAMIAVALAPAANAATHHKKHHAAAPPPVDAGLKSEVDALKAQVDALQSREEQDSAARQATQDQVQQLQGQLAAANARADHAEAQVEAQIQTIPGVVDTAVAKVKPKNDALYVKGLKLTIGGFTALETVTRDKNMSSDIVTNFAAIPYPDIPASHANETRFTARQSRVQMLAQGDISPTIHISGYGEFDFLANAQTANSNSTNSFNPRIRNLYGALDIDNGDGTWHFLAGQSWSLLTVESKGIMPRSELPPPTIDAQYVVGFMFARQPQLRVTYDWHKEFWASVSLENPQSTFAGGSNNFLPGLAVINTSLAGDGSGGSLFFQDTSFSLNSVPDVIGKVAMDESPGGHAFHAEAFGILRDFYERVNMGGTAAAGSSPGTTGKVVNRNATGWGVGGSIVAQIAPGMLDMQGSAIYGDGIGRYGAAGLPDVAFSPDANLHPIQEWALMGGLTWHATPHLNVYVFGGEESEAQTAFNMAPSGGGSVVHGGLGNVAFTNNTGCLIESTAVPTNSSGFAVTAVPDCNGQNHFVDEATVGFWHTPWAGSFGHLQWGLQYSWIHRVGWASSTTGGGLVAAPSTSENVFETSFRYYPFQ